MKLGSAISKIGNAQILSSNQRIAPHIPECHFLTKQNLPYMLHRYPTVYVKPDNSCQGKGVIRIDRLRNIYQLKTRDKKTTYRFKNVDQVFSRIQKEKMRRVYLVQRGIDSYTKQGRLFDIRTHLLRINGDWELGGIIGRVANRYGVATNAYSGGTPVPIDTLLEDHLGLHEDLQDRYIDKLTDLSIDATDTFSEHYPKWAEFGLDIGMDKEGHLWIYEINIKPGMLVFRKDRPSYKRIMEMKKFKA